MEQFIEVVGEGSYAEKIFKYRAEINLKVRAAQADVAMREVGELRNQCIAQLKQGGLQSQELIEGGGEVWRPWYDRKKVVGQEASHAILIHCPDLYRMQMAVGSLENLFENQRYTFSFSMNTPQYSIVPDDVSQAWEAAMTNARKHADLLARAGGVRITHAIQIEELVSKTARSGMKGDEGWMYAAAGAASLGASEPEPLEAASRSTAVRYRVRFACEALV